MRKYFRIAVFILAFFQINWFCACSDSVPKQPSYIVDNGGHNTDNSKDDESKIPLTGEWNPEPNPEGEENEMPKQHSHSQAFLFTNYCALTNSFYFGTTINNDFLDSLKIYNWGKERFSAFCEAVGNGDKKIWIPYYKGIDYPYNDGGYTPIYLWFKSKSLTENNYIQIEYSCNYRGRFLWFILYYDAKYINEDNERQWGDIKEYLADKFPDEEYEDESFRTIRLYDGSEVLALYGEAESRVTYNVIKEGVLIRITLEKECDTEEFWSTLSFRTYSDGPLN